MHTFSSCGEQGLLSVAVCGLLIAVTSLVVERRFEGAWTSAVAAYGLSSCGSWTLKHRQYLWRRGMVAA